MTARYSRAHAYDDTGRHAGVVYMLMLVVALAFGGFVWQLFSPPETPRIAPASAAYKSAPPPEATNAPDQAEQNAFFDTLEGETAERAATPRPGPEAIAEDAPIRDAPGQIGPAPAYAEEGPFVAQLAALQSQAAADTAWRRLSSRAPDLFGPARLDVERADLGQRGVYYRVRAGYFADRTNASRFCDRIRRMGQDCIVSAR